MHVMKIIRTARPGAWTPFAGQYVVEYDPTRPGSQPGLTVHLVCSRDPGRARRFASPVEAYTYWRQDSGRPYPADRPLTAYTIAIEDLAA